MRNKFLFTALFLALSAQAGPVNLVTNGSFEQTPVGNGQWVTKPSLPGWSAGPLGIELRNNVAGKAQNGSNYVELDTSANSFMSQDLLGTDSVRGWVTLSFWYSARPNTGADTNGLTFGFGDSLYSLTNIGNPTNSNQWRYWTGSFNLGASDTLRFTATSKSDGLGMALDNISVTQAANKVPEPGALALLGVGLLALGVSRRTRKAPRQ